METKLTPAATLVGQIVHAACGATCRSNSYAMVVRETASRVTLQPMTKRIVEDHGGYGQEGKDVAGQVDVDAETFTAFKTELGLRTGERGARTYYRPWDGDAQPFYGD